MEIFNWKAKSRYDRKLYYYRKNKTPKNEPREVRLAELPQSHQRVYENMKTVTSPVGQSVKARTLGASSVQKGGLPSS